MSLIVSLPDDVSVVILCEWLGIRELAYLDSAFASRTFYPSLQNIFQHERLVASNVHEDFIPEGSNGWIARKNIKVSLLELSDDEEFRGNTTKVEKLIVYAEGTLELSKTTASIINACPLLRSLTFSFPLEGNELDKDFTISVKRGHMKSVTSTVWERIEQLTFDSTCITRDLVKYISSVCANLKDLRFINLTGIDTKKLFLFLQSCSKLETLVIHTCMRNDLFHLLLKYRNPLRHIKVLNAGDYDILLVNRLIKHFEPTLEHLTIGNGMSNVLNYHYKYGVKTLTFGTGHKSFEVLKDIESLNVLCFDNVPVYDDVLKTIVDRHSQSLTSLSFINQNNMFAGSAFTAAELCKTLAACTNVTSLTLSPSRRLNNKGEIMSVLKATDTLTELNLYGMMTLHSSADLIEIIMHHKQLRKLMIMPSNHQPANNKLVNSQLRDELAENPLVLERRLVIGDEISALTKWFTFKGAQKQGVDNGDAEDGDDNDSYIFGDEDDNDAEEQNDDNEDADEDKGNFEELELNDGGDGDNSDEVDDVGEDGDGDDDDSKDN